MTPGWPRRLIGISLVLCVSLASLVGGLHAYAVHDRGPPAAQAPAQTETGTRADLAQGLVHVRIAGEGYALGHAHGRLLRPEIGRMVSILSKDLIRTTVARDVMLLKAWRLDERAPARYRDEMRGVADGAGVQYADVLLINTFDDLMHLVGCSSAVVLPAGGEPLRHGRNLDYAIPALARFKAVFDIETRGLRLRTVGFPGYIGVLTGMNSRGLGLTSHTSATGAAAVGVPSGLVYRQMLEEGRDLPSMQAVLAASARTIGNNLALSDARAGAALALEFDAAHLAARGPEGGLLLVTNHFQIPAMQARQDRRWYAPESGSVARVACLARSLRPGRGADHGDRALRLALSERGPGRAWRTPANPGTVQSVVMEPATGRLLVAKGLSLPVTEGGYVEVPARWPASAGGRAEPGPGLGPTP
jgi:isopenicillin-N N-acyltransferase-like protein